jgi:hypothetical protein
MTERVEGVARRYESLVDEPSIIFTEAPEVATPQLPESLRQSVLPIQGIAPTLQNMTPQLPPS